MREHPSCPKSVAWRMPPRTHAVPLRALQGMPIRGPSESIQVSHITQSLGILLFDMTPDDTPDPGSP
ncbi:unnamed protein product [Darwinula stevensoni]|uniref:Uncharacterized protein n=1 Tax=Darwinula stevensoni TaxID=69355 RepID=A0A7R8XM15_9CRUS|nr:unnamed protein product [Darwinula stevensoni]CAG0894982.1 unnamed protein product [Darwinula stevensoni]